MNGDHTSVDDDDDFICRFKCVYSTQILFYGKPTVYYVLYGKSQLFWFLQMFYDSPFVRLSADSSACCLSDDVCLAICGGPFYDYDLISLIMGRSRIVKAPTIPKHNITNRLFRLYRDIVYPKYT